MSKLTLLTLSLPLIFFNNCSEVSFKDTASGGENGNFAAEINQPGSNGSNTPPAPIDSSPPAVQIVPKVTFISPPCQRLTLCQAEFRLDKTYSLRTEFNWRTNDTLYMTPHNPIYAQPGTHYNPTSGSLIFEPGETSKKIYIQNINNYSFEVIIGVIMSQCKYGTYSGTCASFFQ